MIRSSDGDASITCFAQYDVHFHANPKDVMPSSGSMSTTLSNLAMVIQIDFCKHRSAFCDLYSLRTMHPKKLFEPG